LLDQELQFLSDDPVKWGIFNGWLWLHALGRIVDEDSAAGLSRTWIDEWQLGRLVASGLLDLGLDQGAVDWVIATIKPLVSHQHWFSQGTSEQEGAYGILRRWLSDVEVQRVLQVNRHRDVLWFNREAFEQWLDWMMLIAALDLTTAPEAPSEAIGPLLSSCRALIARLRQAAQESGYRVSQLLDAAR
jgi:hypothetical protein